MKGCTLAAWGLLLAGCSDPVLAIRLERPASLLTAAVSGRLRVLVPPLAAPFGCDDLAFGRVDAERIELAEVSRAELSEAEEVPVASLSRQGVKLFFAEAFSSSDEPVLAACAGLGGIQEDQELRLVGEPITTLSVDQATLAPTFGASETVPVSVRVRDALGQRVPQAIVEVESFGPGTDPSRRSATTDSEGALRLDAPLPPRPGPFAVDLLSRWSLGGRVRVTGFQAPPPSSGRLPAAAYGAAVGRLSPRGPAVATLIGRLSGWSVELYDADSFTAAPEVVPFRTVAIRGTPTLAVIELPDAEQDRVVVVASSSTGVELVRLDPDGTEHHQGLDKAVGAGNPKRVMAAGPCAGGDPRLAVVYEGGFLDYYDLDGRRLGEEVEVSVDYTGSGCLSDDLGVLHRVFVRPSALGTTIIEVADGAPPRPQLEWLAPTLGLAFSPLVGGMRQLLGAQRSLDQPMLARAQLVRGEAGLTLATITADPVVGAPVVTAGVDLDADQRLDVIALTARVTPEGRPSDYALYGSLGRTREGRPVTGTFPLPTKDLCNAVLVAGDFDADQVVDVIVAEGGTPILCGRFDAPRTWFYPLGPGRGG